MEHRTWTFLNNPFLTVAKESRPKAITISTYTYGALDARKTDAFFGPLFLFYKPLHNALLAEEAEWKSQIGTQKGSTAAFDQLLKDLSPGKLYGWDLAVQNIYAKGSPGYIAVFPQGHNPYQSGSKDDRVGAVKTLSESLGVATAPTAFAPIKTDVDAFLLLIQQARTAQTGNISNTGTESAETTVAVTNAMNGLYKVLGTCMAQFSENPTVIEPIFDLQTIRNLQQTKFTDHVSPSATKNIFKRILEPTVRIRIKVFTPEPLTFWFAEEKNDPVGAVSFTVQGFEEEFLNVSQLGNVPLAAWFKVQNLSAAVEGQFEIEIL